ncbi:hypothetical protein F5X71_05580 [Nocardia brasiliensis]|uniref:Uncharacterized protein n=1 Tax=Nocardia brasiliensis TaxID=37326 RepID=A0A6G9XLS1_NOCBR|nr:hypothetical protein F5X71_05580 [Nocardia brasiliensis]
MATLFAAPAGAAPGDPTVPPTTAPPAPSPAQPGVNEAPPSPDTTKPDPNKPTVPPAPSPSQPGVTTPDPDQVMPNPQKDPKLAQPTQPGVTTPRIAPLPVPGQKDQPLPAVVPDPPAGAQDEQQPGEPKQAQPGTAPGTQAQPGTGENAQAQQPETLVQPQQQPRWQAPQLQAAPPAPVVEMTGPHQEIGANIDGGSVLPGYVANTHHFNNEHGYVGTVGYRTPTGAGEAGVSVEYVDANTVKVTTYTGGEGLSDNKTISVFDTTQANLAKAAVENWIREQPGGAAALEAAAQVKLPLQPGDLAPQTVEVGGVTTQWGGSLQY